MKPGFSWGNSTRPSPKAVSILAYNMFSGISTSSELGPNALMKKSKIDFK
jgi:hypothetical protein